VEGAFGRPFLLAVRLEQGRRRLLHCSNCEGKKVIAVSNPAALIGPMHPRDQTIFALSSGRPPSAIAIVRVSGAHAGAALEQLAGKIPAPRMATRALLRDPSGEGIDDAVVLWFPGPASATGEDVAEFHVHGGRAVLASLFAALTAIDN